MASQPSLQPGYGYYSNNYKYYIMIVVVTINFAFLSQFSFSSILYRFSSNPSISGPLPPESPPQAPHSLAICPPKAPHSPTVCPLGAPQSPTVCPLEASQGPPAYPPETPQHPTDSTSSITCPPLEQGEGGTGRGSVRRETVEEVIPWR